MERLSELEECLRPLSEEELRKVEPLPAEKIVQAIEQGEREVRAIQQALQHGRPCIFERKYMRM